MMTEDPGVVSGASHSVGDVLRERAAASREQRDRALEELRALVSDEEIAEEFGIDVRRLT